MSGLFAGEIVPYVYAIQGVFTGYVCSPYPFSIFKCLKCWALRCSTYTWNFRYLIT